MKAFVIDKFGDHTVIQEKEMPIPDVGSDDILVKVHATTVNPIDWKMREGLYVDYFPVEFPFILGSDFSGEVLEIGSDVQNFKVGDLVYGKAKTTRNGSYAEYIAVPQNEACSKPNVVDHTQAAAIPTVGITAWEALFDKANLQAGQKVTIIGASGGVGSIAVQLAKHKKAIVTGVTSSKNADMVISLGADAVVCYDTQEISSSLSNQDVVFDTVGSETMEEGWKILKDDGYHVSCSNIPTDNLKNKYPTVRSNFIFIKPNANILSSLKNLIEEHAIKPVIDTIYKLSEIRDAHIYVKKGRSKGKVCIKVI